MRLNGIAASKGLSVGPAVVLSELPPIERKQVSLSDVEHEKNRLSHALERIRAELEELKNRISPDLQGIMRAQLLFLEDPDLMEEMEARLDEGKCAEWVAEEAIDEFVESISLLQNDYLKERASDVRDFQKRLLAALMGLPAPGQFSFSEPSILIAKDLTPSDTAGLDVTQVLGFAIELGGPTSHSAIMARASGLPAVVGVSGLLLSITNGDFVVLNAETGEILINPPDDIRTSYEARIKERQIELLEARSRKELPAVTTDGREVELCANIGGPQDMAGAIEWGAKGVGLFRTEFLYMQSNRLPSEEVQYKAYKEVIEKNAPHSVIFRTLDIGGDKALPYLEMETEENPFLGHRAIRLCLDRPDLFTTQLRAILRAGRHGSYRVMFPMVATLVELRQAKDLLMETAAELGIETLPEIGIMIEIPAAAVLAKAFAKEVDFFSIGSNDLIQYTMAADRGNKSVSYLYQHLEPAVLHLIQGVIEAAHAVGKWVGMCGEMAGDPQAIPVLLGLGLDEFSMSASSLPQARERIRSLSYKDCQAAAQRALQCGTVEEVKALMKELR